LNAANPNNSLTVIFLQPELTPEQKQAVGLKEKGNDAYKHKQFDDALNFYSQAIDLDPKNMLLYTNKAGTSRSKKYVHSCTYIIS